MSDESEYLREQIRSGAIAAERHRLQWESVVTRIYDLEREEARERDLQRENKP